MQVRVTHPTAEEYARYHAGAEPEESLEHRGRHESLEWSVRPSPHFGTIESVFNDAHPY